MSFTQDHNSVFDVNHSNDLMLYNISGVVRLLDLVIIDMEMIWWTILFRVIERLSLESAKLFNWNFRPLRAASRWSDPQLQLSKKHSFLLNFRRTRLLVKQIFNFQNLLFGVPMKNILKILYSW